MCGNGAMTGMRKIFIRIAQRIIHKEDQVPLSAPFCVAVAGTPMAAAAGWRIATPIIPSAAAAPAVFVLPGLLNYTMLFYSFTLLLLFLKEVAAEKDDPIPLITPFTAFENGNAVNGVGDLVFC